MTKHFCPKGWKTLLQSKDCKALKEPELEKLLTQFENAEKSSDARAAETHFDKAKIRFRNLKKAHAKNRALLKWMEDAQKEAEAIVSALKSGAVEESKPEAAKEAKSGEAKETKSDAEDVGEAAEARSKRDQVVQAMKEKFGEKIAAGLAKAKQKDADGPSQFVLAHNANGAGLFVTAKEIKQGEVKIAKAFAGTPCKLVQGQCYGGGGRHIFKIGEEPTKKLINALKTAALTSADKKIKVKLLGPDGELDDGEEPDEIPAAAYPDQTVWVHGLKKIAALPEDKRAGPAAKLLEKLNAVAAKLAADDALSAQDKAKQQTLLKAIRAKLEQVAGEAGGTPEAEGKRQQIYIRDLDGSTHARDVLSTDRLSAITDAFLSARSYPEDEESLRFTTRAGKALDLSKSVAELGLEHGAEIELRGRILGGGKFDKKKGPRKPYNKANDPKRPAQAKRKAPPPGAKKSRAEKAPEVKWHKFDLPSRMADMPGYAAFSQVTVRPDYDDDGVITRLGVAGRPKGKQDGAQQGQHVSAFVNVRETIVNNCYGRTEQEAGENLAKLFGNLAKYPAFDDRKKPVAKELYKALVDLSDTAKWDENITLEDAITFYMEARDALPGSTLPREFHSDTTGSGEGKAVEKLLKADKRLAEEGGLNKTNAKDAADNLAKLLDVDALMRLERPHLKAQLQSFILDIAQAYYGLFCHDDPDNKNRSIGDMVLDRLMKKIGSHADFSTAKFEEDDDDFDAEALRYELVEQAYKMAKPRHAASDDYSRPTTPAFAAGFEEVNRHRAITFSGRPTDTIKDAGREGDHTTAMAVLERFVSNTLLPNGRRPTQSALIQAQNDFLTQHDPMTFAGTLGQKKIPTDDEVEAMNLGDTDSYALLKRMAAYGADWETYLEDLENMMDGDEASDAEILRAAERMLSMLNQRPTAANFGDPAGGHGEGAAIERLDNSTSPGSINDIRKFNKEMKQYFKDNEEEYDKDHKYMHQLYEIVEENISQEFSKKQRERYQLYNLLILFDFAAAHRLAMTTEATKGVFEESLEVLLDEFKIYVETAFDFLDPSEEFLDELKELAREAAMAVT